METSIESEDARHEPATTLSPFDRVFRGILRGLYEGRYVPGQRLIAPDLMREFEVGRGTIREVLQRFASSGVVQILPQKGAQVRRLSRREVAEVLDLVEVLLGLAGRGAARAVAEKAKREELLSLYTALMAARPETDFPGFVSAREDYYRCIVALGGNRELQRVFPSIQVHIIRVQLRAFDRAADAVDQADYKLLQDAILTGVPDRAEMEGRIHVQRTMGRVARLPDRAFEPEARGRQ